MQFSLLTDKEDISGAILKHKSSTKTTDDNLERLAEDMADLQPAQ